MKNQNLYNIRVETPADYETVETLTRRAFYNMYIPGCSEHYLVRTMRSHEDFIPQLALIAELDGQIIGNIMYTKAKLVDEAGETKEILTFGPLCIAPEYQRRGCGKALMQHSFQKAVSMGYDVVVIFGSPSNYVSSGFQSCKKHNVCLEGGKFPAAMMVKELKPGALDGRRWFYYDSPAMQLDEEAAQRYDDSLEPMEKKHQPSQEEFYILSNAALQ